MATHILCHLAVAQKKEKGATSGEIARYIFSTPSLVRLIANYLEDKELVKPRIGFGGGYSLAKKPEEINLREVFEAVEKSKRDFWGIDKLSDKKNIIHPISKIVQKDLELKLSKPKEDMLQSLSLITIHDVAENALLEALV